MVFGRFVYFLTHPSEYIGLWTLDATVLFSVLTLLVVLKQLFVAQRQMDIMVRQDETNRELLSQKGAPGYVRRARTTGPSDGVVPERWQLNGAELLLAFIGSGQRNSHQCSQQPRY